VKLTFRSRIGSRQCARVFEVRELRVMIELLFYDFIAPDALGASLAYGNI